MVLQFMIMSIHTNDGRQLMLYGPKGLMCCECAKWDECLVDFFPDFSTMKVIMFYKEDDFKEVKCSFYEKERIR